MSLKLRNVIAIIFVCLVSSFVYAQDTPPPPTRMIPPPPGLPIDGLVLGLLLIGVVIGVSFSIYKERSKNWTSN